MLRKLFYLIVDLVAPNAKAIVAFVVTTAVVWLAKQGIEIDVTTADALSSALSGLVTAVLVWLTSNSEK